jgi:hypothetical protein
LFRRVAKGRVKKKGRALNAGEYPSSSGEQKEGKGVFKKIA